MTFYKWSKTAASNSNADSTINYAEGMAPSAVNDSGRAGMAANAKGRDDVSGSLTTGGSATAFTVATNQVFDTLAHMDGMMIAFRPHATSGAAPTLNVDSLGAKAINISTGVAVPTGALILGTPYVVTYIHASTEFIVQGVLAVAVLNDPLEVLSVDAGAGSGPTLDLYRNSASPAVSDFLGMIQFSGKDSAGNKEVYARMFAQILDPTNTSEDAAVYLQQLVAGSFANVFLATSTLFSTALIVALSNVTNALSLAGGTTGQRNGSPTEGDIRYNTTLHGLEYWNGTAWVVLGQAPTIQKFTSGTSQTYTASAGVVRQRVRLSAPGGGGGAQTTNAGANGSANTSFQVNGAGTAWTAVAGAGGATAAGNPGSGGSGGTDGSTGTLVVRIAGADGQASGGGSANNFPGGAGGSNPFGGAGGTLRNNAGVAAKANTGGGGGGAGGNNSATVGGAGGGAGEYVEFWVTGMATATYTVGAGGAGGSAGVAAGGNGAAGIIIIEEFYS